MTEAKKTCFIIMPVTTPDAYSNIAFIDRNHFQDVLEHLFEPAVRSAGYKPLPPVMEASEVINAGIIQRLLNADMVLCDMSSLNPNVFFELGIRTALNKPVCLVKDKLTEAVPFDTHIMTYHTYPIHDWNIENCRESLTSHLKAAEAQCRDENPLWKYFGIRVAASQKQANLANKDEMVSVILDEIAGLREAIQGSSVSPQGLLESAVQEFVDAHIVSEIADLLRKSPHSFQYLRRRLPLSLSNQDFIRISRKYPDKFKRVPIKGGKRGLALRQS